MLRPKSGLTSYLPSSCRATAGTPVAGESAAPAYLGQVPLSPRPSPPGAGLGRPPPAAQHHGAHHGAHHGRHRGQDARRRRRPLPHPVTGLLGGRLRPLAGVLRGVAGAVFHPGQPLLRAGPDVRLGGQGLDVVAEVLTGPFDVGADGVRVVARRRAGGSGHRLRCTGTGGARPGQIAVGVARGAAGRGGGHRCGLSFPSSMSVLTLRTVSSGTGGVACLPRLRPSTASPPATANSTTATINAASQAGITSAKASTTAVSNAATPYSATTPPPPSSPAPIPARLPFSVISTLASASSSRTSREICSAAWRTSSPVDGSGTAVPPVPVTGNAAGAAVGPGRGALGMIVHSFLCPGQSGARGRSSGGSAAPGFGASRAWGGRPIN